MQERYTNRKLYFDEQSYTTEKYVLPYIEQYKSIDKNCKILEVGCGEGGNLKPFLDRGVQCMGIDLNKEQIANAKQFFQSHPNMNNMTLIEKDIYDFQDNEATFDIIMLRDVIEHIHNQEKFMNFILRFLNKDGVLFFAFPPWFMPFGGHQQVCQSKLSKLPYFHLLPAKCYAQVLRWGHEDEKGIADLLEIKETGITIERFERICKVNDLTILNKTFYFINPNYEIKFRLKPRKTLPILRSLPYIRDFYTTAVYYLLKK